MKKDIPDDDRDLMDEDNDTLDLYNEELARKAVGSLFDDAEELETPDDERYVTGFDKPASPPRSRVRPVETRRVAESRRDAEPEDDDYYEYRKRDRSKESTPSPRPAVKVNVASSTPRPSGSGSRSRPLPTREEDDVYEDDYDSFRQRYKDRDRVPGPRYTEPAPSRPPRTVSERSYEEFEDAGSSSPMRWIAAAASFVLLIVLAFLVYRITILSGQLNDANEKLANSPSNESQITEMRLTIESQDALIIEKDEEISRLQAELAQGGSSSTGSPNANTNTPGTVVTEPDDPSSGQAQAQEPEGPIKYTVVKGDNLSKISTKFYGNANPSNIQKIRDANALTNDNIQIGQTLMIP